MSEPTDTELADAIFDLLDTNIWDWDESMNTWCELHGHAAYAEIFVRDWRVAGACLEKMTDFDIAERMHANYFMIDNDYKWLKDPRAICMAFVEAQDVPPVEATK